MDSVIFFLFVYSLFFFFNFTLIGENFSKPLGKLHNKAKVRKSSVKHQIIYHATYPLFCAYCFAFWVSLFVKKDLQFAFACAIVSGFLEIARKTTTQKYVQ